MKDKWLKRLLVFNICLGALSSIFICGLLVQQGGSYLLYIAGYACVFISMANWFYLLDKKINEDTIKSEDAKLDQKYPGC